MRSKIRIVIKKIIKVKKAIFDVGSKKTRILIKTLFLLFIFESTLGILELLSVFEEPYAWDNRNFIAYKTNQCRELFSDPEHAGKIKVVMMGDSIPISGFDPKDFDKQLDEETISFNLGIKGTGTRFQALLIQDVVIPKLNPDLIIWGLKAPQDFENEGRTKEIEDENLANDRARSLNGNLGFDIFTPEFYHRLGLAKSIVYRCTAFEDEKNDYIENDNKLEEYLDEESRGFVSSDTIYPGENETEMIEKESDAKFDEKAGDDFRATINYLNLRFVKYLVVETTHRFKDVIYDETEALFEELPSENYLDLNGEEEFANNDLFRNSGHFNYDGAEVYTEFIADKTEKLLDL